MEGQYQVAMPRKKNTSLPQDNCEMESQGLERTECRLLNKPKITTAYYED